MVSDFRQYRRKHIAELRPYVPGEDLSGVSISAPDKEGGSPKVGDMIARNPKNHKDQWLVAEQYFKDNFEPVEAAPQPSGMVEALKRIAQLKEVRRGGGVFDYEPALSAMEMYEIAFDALEAAARVRAEADAGEPVTWPKIMYVCENCLEYNPEMCGYDRRDIYVTPDGRWLCDSCIDEEGTSSRDCTTPPMLYAHPAPQPRGKIEEAALKTQENQG